MKQKLKKAAFCLAVILITFVIIVASLFLGNPISYLLAWGSATTLINTEYKGKDYKIESIGFEMMHGDYVVEIKSPTKVDEYFTLWIDGFGNIRTNNYDFRVQDKVNTKARLGKEYKDFVAETGFWAALSITYEYKDARILTHSSDYDGKAYIPHEDALTTEEVELNKNYDIKELARVHGQLVIQAMEEEPTYERLAEILLQAKQLADEKGVPFYTISVYLKEAGDRFSDTKAKVVNFRYEEIYEADLAARAKANSDNYEKLSAEAGLGEYI